MKFVKLNIEDYKEKTEAFLEKYAEYLDKLAVINKSEETDIKKLANNEWDEYKEKYPEKVEECEQLRKQLKEEYGEYSSYFNCPYYCVITNKDELDKICDDEEAKKSKSSWYAHVLNIIDNNIGKKFQDEHKDEICGICKGVAYFIDEIYYYLIDKNNNYHFALNVKPYNKWDHMSYI
mgnify:CR=1 FL=1